MSVDSHNRPQYDLEERTFLFAKDVRFFVKALPYSIANEANQLVKIFHSILQKSQ